MATILSYILCSLSWIVLIVHGTTYTTVVQEITTDIATEDIDKSIYEKLLNYSKYEEDHEFKNITIVEEDTFPIECPQNGNQSFRRVYYNGQELETLRNAKVHLLGTGTVEVEVGIYYVNVYQGTNGTLYVTSAPSEISGNYTCVVVSVSGYRESITTSVYIAPPHTVHWTLDKPFVTTDYPNLPSQDDPLMITVTSQFSTREEQLIILTDEVTLKGQITCNSTESPMPHIYTQRWKVSLYRKGEPRDCYHAGAYLLENRNNPISINICLQHNPVNVSVTRTALGLSCVGSANPPGSCSISYDTFTNPNPKKPVTGCNLPIWNTNEIKTAYCIVSNVYGTTLAVQHYDSTESETYYGAFITVLFVAIALFMILLYIYIKQNNCTITCCTKEDCTKCTERMQTCGRSTWSNCKLCGRVCQALFCLCASGCKTHEETTSTTKRSEQESRPRTTFKLVETQCV